MDAGRFYELVEIFVAWVCYNLDIPGNIFEIGIASGYDKQYPGAEGSDMFENITDDTLVLFDRKFPVIKNERLRSIGL